MEAHGGDPDQPEQVQRPDDRVWLVHEGENAHSAEVLAVWALCVCVRVCVLLEFGQHTLALGVVWVVHNLGSASRKL